MVSHHIAPCDHLCGRIYHSLVLFKTYFYLTKAIAPITVPSPISISLRAVMDVRIPMYAPSFITIMLCSCLRP